MIDKSKLKPGDILLYRVTKKSIIGAQIIGWFQNIVGKSPIHGRTYSHVAIVDWDTEYVLESRWPKSRRWKIDWKKLESHFDIEVWRVKGATKAEVEAALSWAHNNLGQWYDLGLFVWGMFDAKHAEVCSTFVTKAWGNAERVFKKFKRIGKVKEFISPDEIADHHEIIERVQ